jgi:trans-2,3-dihydro-3-hydroxyanthranilate isomerase
MSQIPFFLLDVFATEKFTGNQLAVCFDADNLTTGEMQQIARELNFSETTFITHPEPVNGGYNTRIFTPTTELPFAGHPTLGTAFAIQQQLIRTPVDRIALNYQVGQIPVDLSYRDNRPDLLWMHQQSPQFFDPLSADIFAPIIGVAPTDIDSRYPIVPVSTGLPFIIIPLTSLAAVSRAKLNLSLYADAVADLPAQAILIFCPETIDQDRQLHVRVFTECFGVPEDPATGSANGCLTAYLVHYHYFDRPEINITVEQGIELGRPSLLYLRGRKSLPQSWEISVGGRVINIASGVL